jgi:uncharacterized protein (DUF1330 family)
VLDVTRFVGHIIPRVVDMARTRPAVVLPSLARPRRIVVIVFASVEKVRQWYDSPAYLPINFR